MTVIAGGGGRLRLDADHLVGRGLHRACYVHPHAPDKCIKVLSARHREASYEVEKRREISYYRLLTERGNSWRHVARYYGEAETCAGRGSVFELLRDADGEVSKTLEFYLAAPLGGGDAGALASAVQTLYAGMLDECIITMNIKAKNIVWQRAAGRVRLVLVDGLGHADYIPVCDYVAFLARLKIRRRWMRFAQVALQTCAGNHELERALFDVFASLALCRSAPASA